MENIHEPSPLRHDLTFEITTGGYEVWFSDRIALDRPDLVDQCADCLDHEAEVINIGQLDHRTLMADGVLTDALKTAIVDWWRDRLPDLDQG